MPILKTRLAPLAALLLVIAARADTPAAPHGALLREAIIRVQPDDSSAQVDKADRGRELVILDRTHDWLKVLAILGQEKQVTGWILSKGVVLSDTSNGDRILFAAAEDAEDEAAKPHGRHGAAQEAIRLYSRLVDLFPQSPQAGEAYYRAADIYWQLQAVDVMSLPSAQEQDPDLRSHVDEDWMHDVIKKYPHTKWADLAAYHFIENKVCGNWLGQSKCPEKETDIYEKYVREHPQSPKAPEALYQALWRQAALIEIYKTEDQPGKSSGARARALQLAQRLASEYPQSDYAGRALHLQYLVEQDIPAYGSATQ
jgi:outer membrane protein assembly factor BamD (BamD/ComL family)